MKLAEGRTLHGHAKPSGEGGELVNKPVQTADEEEREALCRKCGRCCSVKVVIQGQVVLSPLYCPFLDEGTMLCTIYPRRYELNPLCTSPEVGIRLGIWPGDCPYVDDPDSYPAPRDMLPEELKAYEAQCRAAQEEIRKAVATILSTNL